MTGPELNDRDKKLLDIFGKTWLRSGPKATEIREATGLRETEATQIVNQLINTEAALAYAPNTVNRLRRIRDDRQRRSRSARRASHSASQP